MENIKTVIEENLNIDLRKLSHTERRKVLKREKRRVRRRKVAIEAAAVEEQSRISDSVADHENEAATDDELAGIRYEEERLRQHELWLKREAEAQAIFAQQRAEAERERQIRDEQQLRLRVELARLDEEKAESELAKSKVEKKKEERRQVWVILCLFLYSTLTTELLSAANIFKPESVHQLLLVVNNDTQGVMQSLTTATPDEIQYSNPPAPTSQANEKPRVQCMFFVKTGACRFGDRCSREHDKPTISCTLLIRNFYTSLERQQQLIGGPDGGLEFEESDAREHYVEFFEDALPELEKAGKVVQFKTCCNYEPHLRGNVYVQYQDELECAAAYKMFHSRYYAQRIISCEYCSVTNWKAAICGLFRQKRCPKGRACNYLHVFTNPGYAFSEMDRSTGDGIIPQPSDRRESEPVGHWRESRRHDTSYRYHDRHRSPVHHRRWSPESDRRSSSSRYSSRRRDSWRGDGEDGQYRRRHLSRSPSKRHKRPPDHHHRSPSDQRSPITGRDRSEANRHDQSPDRGDGDDDKGRHRRRHRSRSPSKRRRHSPDHRHQSPSDQRSPITDRDRSEANRHDQSPDRGDGDDDKGRHRRRHRSRSPSKRRKRSPDHRHQSPSDQRSPITDHDRSEANCHDQSPDRGDGDDDKGRHRRRHRSRSPSKRRKRSPDHRHQSPSDQRSPITDHDRSEANCHDQSPDRGDGDDDKGRHRRRHRSRSPSKRRKRSPDDRHRSPSDQRSPITDRDRSEANRHDQSPGRGDGEDDNDQHRRRHRSRSPPKRRERSPDHRSRSPSDHRSPLIDRAHDRSDASRYDQSPGRRSHSRSIHRKKKSKRDDNHHRHHRRHVDGSDRSPQVKSLDRHDGSPYGHNERSRSTACPHNDPSTDERARASPCAEPRLPQSSDSDQ